MTNKFKTTRVGVLYGGLSSERDVSLQSGEGVFKALQSRGYDVVAIDWKNGSHLPDLLRNAGVQVVWNALHGTFGEDGAVQGTLTCLQIPYTGSGILASSLAMDKVMTKRIFDWHKVPSAAWATVEKDSDWKTQLKDWKYPLVVKPSLEGSSVGVSIVKNADQLPSAIELAVKCRGVTIVEEFIPGTEVNTAVVGNQVLGSIEIRPATEFYDYEAKYTRDDTQYLIPTTLAPDILARTEEAALMAHRALDCSDYSRVDLRITPQGEPFVLEVNTLPGMTSHSLLPKIAAYRGIDYATLCERILAMAHC